MITMEFKGSVKPVLKEGAAGYTAAKDGKYVPSQKQFLEMELDKAFAALEKAMAK